MVPSSEAVAGVPEGVIEAQHSDCALYMMKAACNVGCLRRQSKRLNASMPSRVPHGDLPLRWHLCSEGTDALVS